jgi:protein-L-isoaspartate(D-aspartate) O-methyltransferase
MKSDFAIFGSDENLTKARNEMMRQIRAYGVTDRRILREMEHIPRHLFIPGRKLSLRNAYGDHPCDIGYGQTISQPYIVAYMSELLSIKEDDNVLEIGTGSGYQTALLAGLASEVYSIETIRQLAQHAESVLRKLDYTNIHLKEGNGYKGWAEFGPYQAIIVSCAPQSIPSALVEQLDDDGCMVLPLGDYNQRLVVITKKGDDIEMVDDLPVRFVPMV